MSIALRVDNLRKSYGPAEAVRGVSFEVARGEVFGLLGPNGAGKTTTIECAVGLREPDAGTVEIAGLDARRHPRRVKRLVGAALQSTMLADKITPREALHLFAALYGRRGDDVEALLERFSLLEKADARYETLSGGQKQRVAVALAMVNRPEVLFLDEPTAGLDPQARRELHDVIRRARGDGHAVVLTTHYIEEAQQLCDRIVIADHGRVIAAGTPRELVARAKSPPRVRFTAARVPAVQDLLRLPGATAATVNGAEGTVHTTTPGRAVIELVKRIDAEPGNELIDLSIHKPSLEDVFVELTGRALRD